MLNYKWTISALDCIPNFDNVENFVLKIHWRYAISNGEISTDIYGEAVFEKVINQNDFIPFNELTETIVIGWLESSLDVQTLQSILNTKFDNLINPKIIQPELPWLS